MFRLQRKRAAFINGGKDQKWHFKRFYSSILVPCIYSTKIAAKEKKKYVF